jgi:hypothetical protein
VFTVSHILKIRFGRSVNIILFIQSIYFLIFIAFQVDRLDATISIYFATGHLRVGSAAEYFIFENRKIM